MDLEKLKIDRSGSAPTRRRRSRVPWGWLVVLALAGAGAWVFRSPLRQALDRWRLPRVQAVRVERTSPLAATAVEGTAANGYVVARRRAALSADTPGRIVEMNVEEGSVVSRGEVVARLYADEYRASLRRAEADLLSGAADVERARAEVASAEKRLEELRASASAAEARRAEAEAARHLAELRHGRQTKLLDQNVVSQDMVDDARGELDRTSAQVAAAEASLSAAQAALVTGESQVEVARAAVEQAAAHVQVMEAARDEARATLDKTEVRAPFDGVVVLKDAEVGEVVSPNTSGGVSTRGSVVTMVDFDSLEVQVEVQETSLPAVELGAPVNIYLDAWPADLYRGRVSRVWPTANRQKGTVEVRVEIEDPDERLRPEMGARVVFRPGDAAPAPAADEAGELVLVPSACVARVDGRDAVFVVERGVARLRTVELGGTRGARAVIDAGLEGGELVVLDPPPGLADGERVLLEESP